jgi:hypothetical protein
LWSLFSFVALGESFEPEGIKLVVRQPTRRVGADARYAGAPQG